MNVDERVILLESGFDARSRGTLAWYFCRGRDLGGLLRPTYQATSHHAAAAACVFNARAPLGVTHHTNERARETSTTAPPCPLPTRFTCGTGRTIADKPGFVSRVVVVVVSLVVCLGLLQKSSRATGTVVGNKHTRYSGFVSMFRP